jgi:hypothetical protein
MKNSPLPTSDRLPAVKNTGDNHVIDFTLLSDVRHVQGQQTIVVPPGIDRMTYFLLWLGTWLGSTFLGFILSAIGADNTITIGLVVIATLAQIYFASLRLPNIGYSRWLSLLMIVPIVNLFILGVCLFRK